MRTKDEAKRELILNYIQEHYARFGRAPVVLEIVAGTGLSSATVHRYLVDMREAGTLEYSGKRGIRTPRMKKERPQVYMPVLGSVSCGPGDQEEENILEYIRMPEQLIGKGEFYALIAKGHSMMDAGVDEGDYVIVRKQDTAKPGDIVVALYDGGLSNLKELRYDGEQQRYYLYSRNTDQVTYAPIYVNELQVQGVAVSVVHSLVQK